MKHVDDQRARTRTGDTSKVVSSKYADELQELAKDPSRIDEFLELAGTAISIEDEPSLSDLLIGTLGRLRTDEEDDTFRNHCNFAVHSDRFACFILEDREKIVASNKLARERFGIRAATHVGDLEFVGLNGETLTELVTSAMARRTPGSKLTPMAQAYSPSLKRRLDLAIFHIHVCTPMDITKEVILISDAITPMTLDLFADKFGLTATEADIVERFSAGQSIQEIADHRCRSIATVKTQFYKVLDKCGAKSQSELLQMVARIERLNAATSAINEEFSHPHRRIFKLMRPGNRTLDVVSAGKPDGRPIVSCNTFTFRTLPAWMEEELYQNNIKLYSIAPPGSGDTSPPQEGQSVEACFAADIVSLLDNVGIDKSVLVGSGTSFPLCLKVAKQIPDRIKALFSNTLVAPAKRVQAARVKRAWLPSMRKLTLGKHEDIDLAVGGALFRVISRIGVKRYMYLATSHHKPSRDTLMKPENLNAHKEAYEASILQGINSNIDMFRQSIVGDWEEDLLDCPVPVHLAIGENDSVGPFQALQDLAQDHPDRITFQKVAGATSVYPLTHPLAFFGALNQVIEAH